MTTHAVLNDLLPVYVTGNLDPAQRQQVEAHLADCAACQADLALWQSVSAEVVAADRGLAPQPQLAERALQRIHRRRGFRRSLRAAWQLLWAQAPLVQRELWPASALVIAIGCVVAVIAKQAVVVQVLAPLIAAACMALLYGPENDPATELTLATPTSIRQILLARLALVFGYNLALMLAASLALLAILPLDMLGSLIFGWLGPMTFLSALALLLSIWFGTNNAVSIAYIAWLSRWIFAGMASQAATQMGLPAVSGALEAYIHFWQLPPLLFLLAAALIAIALWLAGKGQPSFREGTI
jgi:hypothetical protein